MLAVTCGQARDKRFESCKSPCSYVACRLSLWRKGCQMTSTQHNLDHLICFDSDLYDTDVQTCSRGRVSPEWVSVSPSTMPGTAHCPWLLKRHSVHRVSEILSWRLRGRVQWLPCCAAPLFLAFFGDQGMPACRAKKEGVPGCTAALSPCRLHVQ